jgi:hypothetical protein
MVIQMWKSFAFFILPSFFVFISYDATTCQDDHLLNYSHYDLHRPSHNAQIGTIACEKGCNCHGLEILRIPNRETSTYYTQRISILGILIQGPESVAPQALLEAKKIVAMMLEHIRPDIRERLASKKASLAIIPRDQFVTSLPEFSYLSGRFDINGNPYDSFRIRGLGAKRQPVTATSEENLLKLFNDPFRTEDITVHEFAHAIMNLGFAPDDVLKINSLYRDALSKGKFRGSFAMSRVDEFWAELTQSFFSVNNEIGGPEQIAEVDNDSYRFLERIFGFLPFGLER